MQIRNIMMGKAGVILRHTPVPTRKFINLSLN